MKKVFLALTIITLVFSLSACGFLRDLFEDPPIDIIDDNGDIDGYSLTLSSNRGSDFVSVSKDAPYEDGETVTITAELIDDYLFLHWYDMVNGVIYSTDRVLELVMDQDYHLNAIYISADADLDVASNLDGVSIVYTEGPYALGDPITLATPETHEGHTFLYWHDTVANHVFSYDNDVEFDLNRYMNLVAIYQSAPTEYYSTGFDNDEKRSYVASYVNIDGKSWMFETALLGSLANDKRVGSQSVRIQVGGNIRTDFGVEYPTRITFKHATYGNHDLATLRLSFSTDGVEWHDLDEIKTSLDLSNYTYSIDLFTLWDDGLIHPEDKLFFRIMNVHGGVANVDDFSIEHYEDFVGFPNPEHISQFVDFTFEREFTEVYSLGDSWEANTCIALDPHLVEIDCWLSGEIDTSVRGYQTLVYAALDQLGNVTTHTVQKAVMRDATLLDMDLDGFGAYYSDLEGLYGDELIFGLRDILWENLALQRYEDARQILEIADRDPNNEDNVLTIYDRQSVQGTWDTQTWHREHVWPNSRLGVPTISGANLASDLHNLRAIIPSINSSRSNLPFNHEDEPNSWYPAEDRGDVARIYFYMMVMWDQLTLTDDLSSLGDTYTIRGATHGYLSALIDFHYNDPVDAFERNRNNVIYSYQNNRNPFIDYPHFVELIYFDHPNIPEA